MKAKNAFPLLVVLLILFPYCAVHYSNIKANPEIANQRVIPVKLVFEKTWLKRNKFSPRRGLKTLKGISRVYEEQFGIKLSPVKQMELIELPIDTNLSAYKQLAHDILLVQKIDPPKDGIVVCFTSKNYTTNRGLHQWGKARVSEINGRHCLISDEKEGKLGGLHIGASKRRLIMVGVHEFGNMLGANDTDDRNSVMCSYMNFSTVEFDEENRRIILANKWTAFKEQPEQR